MQIVGGMVLCAICEKAIKDTGPAELARRYIEMENFNAKVIQEKERLLRKKSWRDYLPFTIELKWRKK